MGWADYGFPDPTMMPCYKPAEAFYRACAERWNITGAPYPPLPPPESEIYKPDILKSETGANFSYGCYPSIDALRPWRVPVRYINHLIDFENEPVLPIDILFRESDYSANMNSIIEERDTSGLGYLHPSLPYLSNMMMLPEWSKIWLMQRYLAYNLLKVIAVPLKITVRNAPIPSTWLHELTSPEMAFNYAVAHSTTYVIRSGDIGAGWQRLFNKTDILRSPYGTMYVCGFSRVEKVEIDYDLCPNLVGLPADLYVSYEFDSYLSGYVFDKQGFPLRDNRLFIAKIQLPWQSEGTPPPSHGYTTGSYGFVFDILLGGIDVTSKFEFYDNVDNL